MYDKEKERAATTVAALSFGWGIVGFSAVR